MTASFLLFVACVGTIIFAMARWGLPYPLSAAVQVGVPLWLVYVGALSYFGVVASSVGHMPGIAFVVGPVLLFLVGVLRSSRARSIGLWIPLWILIGLQAYRMVVELFLHQLWLDGLVPRMMTFAGSNFDIYIGATAPLVAWLCRRGRWGLRIALLWNGVGLVAISNVIIRAALTAPGPLNFLPTESPNLAMTLFPYTYLAGFLAPLAVTLHLLSLMVIARQWREGADTKLDLVHSPTAP